MPNNRFVTFRSLDVVRMRRWRDSPVTPLSSKNFANCSFTNASATPVNIASSNSPTVMKTKQFVRMKSMYSGFQTCFHTMKVFWSWNFFNTLLALTVHLRCVIWMRFLLRIYCLTPPTPCCEKTCKHLSCWKEGLTLFSNVDVQVPLLLSNSHPRSWPKSRYGVALSSQCCLSALYKPHLFLNTHQW